MLDLSKIVLKQINETGLKPKPRWQFLLKDYLIWALFGLALIIGSLAFSVILFTLLEHDWEVYEYLNKTFFEYLLLSLPYLWIVITLIFGLAAYYNFKNTRKGYRFSLVLVLVSSILLSIILGSIFYSFGLGEEIDRLFAENVPYYKNVVYRNQDVWNQPEIGLLAGKIVELIDDNYLSLEDFSHNLWQVDYTNSSTTPATKLVPGKYIKVVGQKTDQAAFKATKVQPWKKKATKNISSERKISQPRISN